MNESKWRGISQYTGEMVYGQLLRGENNFNIVTDFKTKAIDIELVPIKKGTQGQCTGLKDKNGREVYEGDVIKFKGDLYEMKFLEKYGRFVPVKPGSVFSWFNFELCEIIGNTHENPELLEVTT